MHVIDTLLAQGLIHSSTDIGALREHFNQPAKVFCGFDPTADSLHVGHLLGLRMLQLFQAAGHMPIALVGGATGFIGDPSGRRDGRREIDEETIDQNTDRIKNQIAKLLEPRDSQREPVIVDNRTWLLRTSIISFLRDVGKHFTLNELLRKDSVKLRQEEGGMSFTELAYSLLQATDFETLARIEDCWLQIGGSDQWGNITAGLELLRRRSHKQGHAIVWPLLLKANGQKFGKSGAGTIWLDPKKTSPFEFFQFWMNTPDTEIETLLLRLGRFDPNDVAIIMEAHRESPQLGVAQLRLAEQMTAWVHGHDEMASALSASVAVFKGQRLTNPPNEIVTFLEGIIPTTRVSINESKPPSIVDLTLVTKLCSSKGEAKRLIAGNGLSLNHTRVSEDAKLTPEQLKTGWILLKKGKQKPHLVRFAST